MAHFKRNRGARRNPVGALYVTNPRKRRPRQNGGIAGLLKRLKARKNRGGYGALALTNRGKKVRARFRRNRSFGALALTNRGKFIRKNRSKFARRNRGLGALALTNRGGYGALALTNRGKFRHNRLLKSGRVRVKGYERGRPTRSNPRRNPAIMAKVTNVVRKVPVVGGPLAGALGKVPGAALGAVAALVPMWLVTRYARPYVPGQLSQMTGTIIGLVTGALAQLAPIPTKYKALVATSAVGIGVSSDVLKAAQSRGYLTDLDFAGLGDGTRYDVVPFADPASQLIQQYYSDAGLGDVHGVYGAMSMDEIGAAVQGPMAWRERFAPTARAQHTPMGPGMSRHAGQPGHRWGWLIRLVGFQKFTEFAELPPEKQEAVMRSFRQSAQKQLSELVEAQMVVAPEPALAGYGALLWHG